jgi:hypothetical protein
MTDSPVKYRVIPSSEGQADHSNVHNTGDDLYYSTVTSERFPGPAEARTKWTYFLLGCAILLPWNGDSSRQIALVLLLVLMTPLSPDQWNLVFLVSTGWLPLLLDL